MWIGGPWWATARAEDDRRSARRDPVDSALVRVRHPSYCDGVGLRIVHDLSRSQLRRLWRRSGRMLKGRLDPETRLNLVMLRARVLDELEHR